MRRAILAVLATAVGLVLLLSFKPHEVISPAARPAAVAEGTGPGADDGDGDGDRGEDGGRFGRGFPDSSGPRDAQTQETQSQETQSQETQGGWSGAGATAGATSGEKTVTGDAADTRWGPVQVEIVISGGRMAGIRVLVAPQNNHRDIEINNEALPILDEEALSARSAQIDVVSGATYTSDGYIRSLQSALDKAGR
ncbi:FMN-binding protein [Microbispora triticiradicis]|uniref:FMN-binding protein n=2 Tax=Microbispora TaxID=2005 RepID=A0ABY3LZ63_9ACTN|nr:MULTISPECIES: FMN-binding protein [Microbispora]TLP63922.1 FMN-binding protein [Microbispora fusca]TYB60763.1 FMN-binding protein [Microbispora tritici]